MLLGDVGAVFGAQQVLEQHLEAKWKTLGALYGVQAKNFVFGALDVEYVLSAEAVHGCHGSPLASDLS